MTGLPDESRLLPSGEEAGTAPDDRRFRPDVEGLRAVAIVLVVLFHAGVPHVQGGYVGVDVFFVISGFVITGLLLRERAGTGGTSLGAFYARRARRILPAAVLVIVVTLVATALLLDSADARIAASDGRWTAGFLANYHLAHVLPNILVDRFDPFGQFWSLAVEEQFYLFYPAFFIGLLLLARRTGTAANYNGRRTLAVGLGMVTVASFALAVSTSHLGLLGPYDSPFTRAWELCTGALVALSSFALRRVPTVLAVIGTWIGMAMILSAAIAYNLLTVYPGYAAALPVAGAALVIAMGTSVPPAGVESMLRVAPFQWVGRLSYSWYLWHWPVLVLFFSYKAKSLESTPVATRLAIEVGALGLAVCTYYFVENPVRHSLFLVSSPRATGIGAALLVGSCVALTYAF